MTGPNPFDCWSTCTAGHTHWGAGGAAGLLLRWRGPGTARYLLVHRASWVHEGGTWSVPGGARQEGESAEHAAHREAVEEIGELPAYRVLATIAQDCGGGWLFSTVCAEVDRCFEAGVSREVEASGWFSSAEMAELPLHPGLRQWLAEHPLELEEDEDADL